MRPKKRGRQHLSKTQPNLAGEHSRNLLGRWLERGEMLSQQHRALGRRILDEPGVTMPRRSTDPYDPGNEARQLRGIPVVGVPGGMGGAMKGTRPGDGIKLDVPPPDVDTEPSRALPCDGQLDAGGAGHHPPTR